MSPVETATGYVNRLMRAEVTGWGDQKNAVQRLATRYRLPFWSLENLRTGRSKTVDAGLLTKLRWAYLDLVERQIAKLQHELAVERAMTSNDALDRIETEAADLLARLQAARNGLT